MKFFSPKARMMLVGACGLLLSGAALAQQAPASETAGRPEVKTIGDWAVRCFPIQSPSPCDIFQEQDYQKTGQRVLSISIAYVPSLDKHALQVSVPLDIAIPKGLVIQTDGYTSPVMKYRRCDRGGCYVELPVDNGMVAALARSGTEGKINIVADSGKAYTLKFSLKGFSQAHDDMASQARAKAKPVQQSAAPAAPAAP